MSSSTSPHVHIDTSDDRSQATVTFTSDDQTFTITLSPEQIGDLISALGSVRQALATPALSIEGARFNPTRNASWAIQPDVETGGSVFAFQHPGYGPVGLTLPPDDAERLAKGLQLHRQLGQAGRPPGRAN